MVTAVIIGNCGNSIFCGIRDLVFWHGDGQGEYKILYFVIMKFCLLVTGSRLQVAGSRLQSSLVQTKLNQSSLVQSIWPFSLNRAGGWPPTLSHISEYKISYFGPTPSGDGQGEYEISYFVIMKFCMLVAGSRLQVAGSRLQSSLVWSSLDQTRLVLSSDN